MSALELAIVYAEEIRIKFTGEGGPAELNERQQGLS